MTCENLLSILADACYDEGASLNQPEDMLPPWERDGATMLDRDGFPSRHEDMVHLLMQDDNVHVSMLYGIRSRYPAGDCVGSKEDQLGRR